jgi:hypothetical protein
MNPSMPNTYSKTTRSNSKCIDKKIQNLKILFSLLFVSFKRRCWVPITGKPFYTLGKRNTALTNVELKADSVVELYVARMYAIFLFILPKAKDDKLGWTWERMWYSYWGRAFTLTVLHKKKWCTASSTPAGNTFPTLSFPFVLLFL